MQRSAQHQLLLIRWRARCVSSDLDTSARWSGRWHSVTSHTWSTVSDFGTIGPSRRSHNNDARVGTRTDVRRRPQP